MTLVAGPAGTIAAVETGAGAPACLLVHGLGATAELWRGTIDHLKSAHRVVAFDLRGHGGSSMSADADYSIAGCAADLFAVADALGLERFVLIGHSFGASVAIAAAGRAPERVLGLVLVDAAGAFTGAPPGALEQFLGALRSSEGPALLRETFEGNLERAKDATRQMILAGVTATPHEVMLGAYESLLDFHPAVDLARYHGPSLLVVDDRNKSIFSLHAQEPQRPWRAVSDTSHWLVLDQPEAFHRVVDAFLATLPAPGPGRDA
ncbi:MAG: alpha/beta fold hydrolase [Gemmatimonadota bacterium]